MVPATKLVPKRTAWRIGTWCPAVGPVRSHAHVTTLPRYSRSHDGGDKIDIWRQEVAISDFTTAIRIHRGGCPARARAIRR